MLYSKQGGRSKAAANSWLSNTVHHLMMEMGKGNFHRIISVCQSVKQAPRGSPQQLNGTASNKQRYTHTHQKSL